MLSSLRFKNLRSPPVQSIAKGEEREERKEDALVDAGEGALDCEVVLEFDGDFLTGEGLEDREDEL